MPQTDSSFRTVMRGYDPAQVNKRIGELEVAAQMARRQVDELTLRVRELMETQAAEADAATPSFENLGQRIGQILTLAEEEAAHIRAVATNEAKERIYDVEQAAHKVRVEADAYAKQQRSDADADTAHVTEETRRHADDILDSAERDATARLQEAEAIYESQRAKAAQSAVDFETTLSARHAQAEEEFGQQSQALQQQLADMETQLDQARAATEKQHADAEVGARRIVEDAQRRADEAVAEGKAQADRIRADSERELAAAMQRRDSINAQLTNVRQMLTTLSGSGSVGLVALDPGPDPDDPAEDVSDEPTEDVAEPDEATAADLDADSDASVPAEAPASKKG